MEYRAFNNSHFIITLRKIWSYCAYGKYHQQITSSDKDKTKETSLPVYGIRVTHWQRPVFVWWGCKDAKPLH